MDKQDLEILRVNAKVLALESIVAMMLVGLVRSERDKELLRDLLDAFPEGVESATFPQHGPEHSDLFAAELHTAFDDLSSFLKAHLENTDLYLTDPIYQDADKAREHLEALRWPDGPVCPHCGVSDNAHEMTGKSTRPGLWKCRDCRKPFSVTVGTVFERSKIPLNIWLLATHLIASSKKGMSSHQLHRTLGVTYKTAWFMAHRIREAMKPTDVPIMGSGGGKARSFHISGNMFQGVKEAL